jgi:hypothetical protein
MKFMRRTRGAPTGEMVYAFTSRWCAAYAAVVSVIILASFWRSSGNRPFQYAGSM